MPLYTGSGDAGETGLFGTRRVPKDDLRIEAYGTVDELNSVLGVIRSDLRPEVPQDGEFDRELQRIQCTLFEVGADLATEGGKASVPAVEAGVRELERAIDASEARLPALRSFVLPGGSPRSAWMHVARTVARRAERRFWTLARTPGVEVPTVLGVYLNRLSDLLFSWARLANLQAGVPDTPWVGRSS